MELPIQHIQERLSVAYVQAVASEACASLTLSQGIEYGMDGQISRVKLINGRYCTTGWSISCQFKSTRNWVEKETMIAYDMEVDAYNKLVGWEGNSPCILILLRLPKDENEWLKIDEVKLVLRNCCYWQVVQGEKSDNTSKVRIEIPRENVLTPQALNNILTQLENNQGKLL